ncbi:serine/threonine-protein kinase [Aliikangiella sp. IMCC44359]|uniref:serine/threonine-protein kinase n=1 Tax=Aliikangiella sp. IMCC44359 TaxID=3459125 RepID=UPI00403AE6D1
MKHELLPIHKTGWFYLLLLLWIGLGWYSVEGGFNWLNQTNREYLYQTFPDLKSNSQLIRLGTPFTKAGFTNITEVLEKYKETPVVFLGDLSPSFKLRLQKYLKAQPRDGKVILATGNVSSALNIDENELVHNWIVKGINQIRYPSHIQMKHLTSNQVIYSPLMVDQQGGIPLIWRDQNGTYLTLIGEAIRQTKLGLSSNIKVGWHLELDSPQMRWPLGINGVVYSAGPLTLPLKIKTFVTTKNTVPPRLIVFDNNAFEYADNVVRTAERLLEQRYLYQNILVKFIQWFVLLIGLAIVWFLRHLKIRYQSLYLIIFGIVLAVCQYIAFTQMLWLSVIPSMIIVFSSWLVILAYRKEAAIVDLLSEKHNQLLGESLPIFYGSQTFEKLEVYLEQTKPNQDLINKAFDIALQAESKNQLTLAQKIYRWIQSSGIKHPESLSKLEEFEQRVSNESLDSTLVIAPGQSSPGLLSMPNYQVESFGRYKVEGVLGKGAMGIVFQGVDPKINRHVAIKTLQLSHDAGGVEFEETKARFFREAETAGNLSHANIVTIYDVGDEGDLGYIAMDLLTGAPLSEFIKPDTLLPPSLVYQLMIQITDALDYAHRQNVVHRDIKPANIIYDDDTQRVTLTDFGIACVADKSKTRTGTIMGSPYYMSPEQVLGKRVDGRSDIFSLGITLYQLLSGHLPFEGESIASVAYRITKSRPTALKNWNTKLPSSAIRITNKAMNKEIEKRFQTAQEFKLALINALKRDFKKAPLV